MKRSLAITGLVMLLATVSGVSHAQWVPTGPVEDFYGLDTDPEGLYIYAHSGNEILRSSDLGQTWIPLSVPTCDLLFSPHGNIIAGTADGEFFRSSDYGDHWDSIGYLKFGVASICMTGNKLIAGSTTGGLFLSKDTGKTWDPIDSGFPIFNGYTVMTISSLYAGDDFIVAGTYYSFGGGLGIFRCDTSDWIWRNVGLSQINIMAFTSIGPLLFVGTYDYESGNGPGVYRSTDSGNTWQADGAPSPYVGVMAITYSPPYLITGHDLYGVFASNDSGNSWFQVPGVPSYPEGWIDVGGVAVEQGIAFATINGDQGGIYRRPLSDFNNLGIVSSNASASPPQIQSYPNPFSSQATIAFSTPYAGYAEVTIVNLLGATVARLFTGELSAGEHSFSWDGSKFAPGMYECVFNMGGKVQQLPMILSR